MQQVLQKPVITEKSIAHAGKGTFTFVVAKLATKEQIKKMVEKTYSVHVTNVKTVNVKGKTRRFGTARNEQKLSEYKKAMVTLKQGEKIELFDLGS